MGNRVGVIFHEDYERFSPLLYSHFGGSVINESFISEYLDSYKDLYPINDDGHKYNCEHMMYGFMQSIGVDLHNRICNVDYDRLKETQDYPNFFDNGCFLVNVSFVNFGFIVNK
jgi:hypothetical protein